MSKRKFRKVDTSDSQSLFGLVQPMTGPTGEIFKLSMKNAVTNNEADMYIFLVDFYYPVPHTDLGGVHNIIAHDEYEAISLILRDFDNDHYNLDYEYKQMIVQRVKESPRFKLDPKSKYNSNVIKPYMP